MKTQRAKAQKSKGLTYLERRVKILGIPKPTKGSKDYPGYTHDEIVEFMSASEYVKFCEWMYGQTCSVGSDGKVTIYAEDVTRFLAMFRHNTPTYWD